MNESLYWGLTSWWPVLPQHSSDVVFPAPARLAGAPWYWRLLRRDCSGFRRLSSKCHTISIWCMYQVRLPWMLCMHLDYCLFILSITVPKQKTRLQGNSFRVTCTISWYFIKLSFHSDFCLLIIFITFPSHPQKMLYRSSFCVDGSIYEYLADNSVKQVWKIMIMWLSDANKIKNLTPFLYPLVPSNDPNTHNPAIRWFYKVWTLLQTLYSDAGVVFISNLPTLHINVAATALEGFLGTSCTLCMRVIQHVCIPNLIIPSSFVTKQEIFPQLIT